jgi:hypothetical protein
MHCLSQLLTLQNFSACLHALHINHVVFSCVFVQVLIAGQGLNNNQWHTLRFSRRGSNLKLQVDDDSPLRGKYLLERRYADSL